MYNIQQEGRTGEGQCKGFVDASKYVNRMVLQILRIYDNAPDLYCCDVSNALHMAEVCTSELSETLLQALLCLCCSWSMEGEVITYEQYQSDMQYFVSIRSAANNPLRTPLASSRRLTLYSHSK
jgi:hypothetical protein